MEHIHWLSFPAGMVDDRHHRKFLRLPRAISAPMRMHADTNPSDVLDVELVGRSAVEFAGFWLPEPRSTTTRRRGRLAENARCMFQASLGSNAVAELRHGDVSRHQGRRIVTQGDPVWCTGCAG
jgi:hypothetical protein